MSIFRFADSVFLRGVPFALFAVFSVFSHSPALAAKRESVSVEDAFWAYDDGVIAYEELEELLRVIGEDPGEACLLWESYGGDPCEKGIFEYLGDLDFRGNFGYSVMLDSSGGIRRERFRASLGFRRFDFGFRILSEDGRNFSWEYWRILYRDEKSYGVLGNVLSSDIGSAVSLEKVRGSVSVVGLRNFHAGYALLTDSTFGGILSWGGKNFRFSGFGAASPKGFRSAFFRARFLDSDVQLSYFRSWETPLLYVSSRSEEKGRLRVRVRGYFHGNRSFPGIFHIPKFVEKNRAVGHANLKYRNSGWVFGLDGKFLISRDSAVANSAVETLVSKGKKSAGFSLGSRWKIRGDSVDAVQFVRSGVRLFSAESLFCEWKWTAKFPMENSLYEIRPGARFTVDSLVSATTVLILRGPGRKPVVFREATRMEFSKYLSANASVELRGRRVRAVRLWRFGIEVNGKW